jgi:hypothetical protein
MAVDAAAARFFAPEHPSDIAAALDWVQERSVGDAKEVWERLGWGGDASVWSILALPASVPHPLAVPLVAGAIGQPPGALRALMVGEAWRDCDGLLRLWPWYPEEDADARPLAEAAAATTGVALPVRHLDEPYDAAWYLRRTGPAALERLLAEYDVALPTVDRVPIPPPDALPKTRFEGGAPAPGVASQAARRLIRAVELVSYVGRAEARAPYLRHVEHALARLCAALGGPPLPTPEPDRSPLVASSEPPVPGRVDGLWAVDDGVVLSAGDAALHVGGDGAIRSVFSGRLRFAAADVAVLEGHSGILMRDLTADRWLEGTVADHVGRLGLTQLPSGAGHDERTEPVISACGRYLLDVDETPYILRLSDDVHVADPFDVLWDGEEDRPRRSRALLRPEDVAVGQITVLDAVRFSVRSGAPPVAQGRSLAFALHRNKWRVVDGDSVLQGRKTLSRLGIRVQHAALTADGATAWLLGEDHLVRVELEPAAVAAVIPVAPLLEDRR